MTRIVRIMGCVLALAFGIPIAETLGQPCPDCEVPTGPKPLIIQIPSPGQDVCWG